MRNSGSSEITRYLHEWNDGDDEAKEELLKLVYDELKRQARVMMSRERGDHTLQPTALVHEAYLKLGANSQIVWKDRLHFYGFASRLMRQILVDHSRRYSAEKRGGPIADLSINEVDASTEYGIESVLSVSEALDELAKLDERQARIVEMRFFGGMTVPEIALFLETSERTVAREWQAAKLWLYRELER